MMRGMARSCWARLTRYSLSRALAAPSCWPSQRCRNGTIHWKASFTSARAKLDGKKVRILRKLRIRTFTETRGEWAPRMARSLSVRLNSHDVSYTSVSIVTKSSHKSSSPGISRSFARRTSDRAQST
ncbi:hypothetical protein EYF80_039666 [Liparis tanakae]|uniref:Uncharacterized protein n=1 Tax=Liparis tanakae TaxID=230148 RepID=A0A4Z2GBW4_9TELE|nr:hypothetical protein EYF80_039666 [Liparis tanakae]